MTIGIYAIINNVNGKKYIGKSINIEKRFCAHKTLLRSEDKNKDCNRHLYNAWKLYGEENFSFIILDTIDTLDYNLLAELELLYMDYHKSCLRSFGYNLRRDSSSGSMEVHEETKKLLSITNTGSGNPNFGNKWDDEKRKRMSETKLKQVADGVYDYMKTPEYRKAMSESSKALWKDTEKKNRMAKKVSEAKSILRFYEYDKKTKELIKVWESMQEILEANPDYHRIAIYSVCNGHKKSYRGSIWVSEEKLTDK